MWEVLLQTCSLNVGCNSLLYTFLCQNARPGCWCSPCDPLLFLTGNKARVATSCLSFLPSPHFPCLYSHDVLQLSLPNTSLAPLRWAVAAWCIATSASRWDSNLNVTQARWVQGELGCPLTLMLRGKFPAVCSLSLIALFFSGSERGPVWIITLKMEGRAALNNSILACPQRPAAGNDGLADWCFLVYTGGCFYQNY